MFLWERTRFVGASPSGVRTFGLSSNRPQTPVAGAARPRIRAPRSGSAFPWPVLRGGLPGSGQKKASSKPELPRAARSALGSEKRPPLRLRAPKPAGLRPGSRRQRPHRFRSRESAQDRLNCPVVWQRSRRVAKGLSRALSVLPGHRSRSPRGQTRSHRLADALGARRRSSRTLGRQICPVRRHWRSRNLTLKSRRSTQPTDRDPQGVIG